MFVLYLNSVFGKAEDYAPVVSAETREDLDHLLMTEHVEGHHEDGKYRQFRKEGILYNFNPPGMDGVNVFGVNEGIIETVSEEDLRHDLEMQIEEQIDIWRSYFGSIPRI